MKFTAIVKANSSALGFLMLGTVLLGMLTIGTWNAAGDSNQVGQMLPPQLPAGNSLVTFSDSPQSATLKTIRL